MKIFGNNALGKIANWPWKIIGLILLTVLFFSFTIVITYDGGHYLNYVAIFERELPASSWDIVRGPVMPIIIFLFDYFFGKTGTGLLVGIYVFYLMFAILTSLIVKELTNKMKYGRLIRYVLVTLMILNPLIFGFYHVLLTEFVAITVMMTSILVAYRWIFSDKNSRRTQVLYVVYAIVIVAGCYHLKQPYLTVSLLPMVIGAVIAIARERKWKNVALRAGTIGASLAILIASIFAWNKVLERIGADMHTGRDSSSIFGLQLLNSAQISADQDGDGEREQYSVGEALGMIAKKFENEPLKTSKIFLQNYCGLISMCKIISDDGVNFYSTDEVMLFALFENSIIGYQTYRDSDSISPMPEGQYERALRYQSNIAPGVFAKIMRRFQIPTNILYKFTMLSYPVFLVFLAVAKIKNHKERWIKSYEKDFCLCLLLLCAGGAHLIASAMAGLIIDRYSLEAFVPLALGIFGTARYLWLIWSHNKRKNGDKNVRH